MSEAQDPRPRPRFGEYAESEANAAEIVAPTDEDQQQHDTVAEAAPASLPGVPHNLGVSGARPSGGGNQVTPPTPPRDIPYGTPYGAPEQTTTTPEDPHTPEPSAAQEHSHGPAKSATPAPQAMHTAPAAAAAQRPGAKPRTGDRIVTILLLAIGAYSALTLGLALMQLPGQFSLLSSILGIDEITPPAAVHTIGTIGAIAMLSIYALVLIYSIRRMRAGKVTFWAPLSAGVLAFIVYVAFATAAYMSSPELLETLSQPESLQRMFDYLESESQ